jgi:hypothetical protein
MGAGESRLIPRPGSGILARFGGVVLLLARADDPAAPELIAAARETDPANAIDGLFQVARKRGGAKVAPFCAIVDDGSQRTLAIHGEMEAVVMVNGSPVRFAGRGAGSRVEEPIPEGATDIAVGDRRPKLGADPLLDLVAGIVPAGSFQLTSGARVTTAEAAVAAPAEPVAEPEPAAAAEPQPMVDGEQEPAAAVESVAVAEPAVEPEADATAQHPAAEADTAEAPAEGIAAASAAGIEADATAVGPAPPTVQASARGDVKQALTIAYQAMTVAPEHAQPPEVEGRLCEMGHLNHPAAVECWICGSAVTGQTASGPRPPLGRLSTKDKRSFILDGDFVIGRKPDVAEDVAAGRARPIEVPAELSGVSRVHAEIRVDGWDVLAYDMGSSNGTYYLPAGAGQWIRMEPHRPVPITSGTTLSLGGFEMIYETV